MKTIAIIPARSGSKRIPKKNIKEFMGRPMISYAIKMAKESGLFDEIMVSTDDIEIAKISKAYGATIPFMRSSKNSSDYATTYDVIEEVLNTYKKADKYFDVVCCIYPCVPLLSTESLIACHKKMITDKSDAVMPVCVYPAPVEWAMKIDNGLLIPHDREAQLIRSQDLSNKYYDVGMFYFCKSDILFKEKTLVPQNTSAYIINESQCQDIDTIEDWKMAELKYKILNRS